MIAQGFGFTGNFLKERNNSAYFRLKKIPREFKEQARARHPGEICGLDQYLKFEHPDALSHQQRWRAALQQPVPQQGVGIDEVTRELLEEIIPNGSPVSNPGFTAFITTGGTTVSTLASTAASIASPQRYLSTAFNLLEPTLSVCCFRYVSPRLQDLDQFNQRLFRRLIRENEFMPSTTRINGKLALRPCFLGARSGRDQVDGLLQSVLRIGDALVAEQG